MTKSGYTDHGLVGSADDTFAFGPEPTAPGSSNGPIIDLELARDAQEPGIELKSRTLEAVPPTAAERIATSVARPVVTSGPPVDGHRQTQKSPPNSSAIKIDAITTEPITPAKMPDAAKKTEHAKIERPIIKRRLFSTAANRKSPSAPPVEKSLQMAAAAAATSIPTPAPETAPPATAPVATSEPPAATEVIPPKMLDLTDRLLLESPRPPEVPKPVRRSSKQTKKAAELAAMIEEDLAQHPDSPKYGLRITVYGGGADWRAMLTILPSAGRVRNAPQLRALTDHLVEGLRQRYNLAWD